MKRNGVEHGVSDCRDDHEGLNAKWHAVTAASLFLFSMELAHRDIAPGDPAAVVSQLRASIGLC